MPTDTGSPRPGEFRGRTLDSTNLPDSLALPPAVDSDSEEVVSVASVSSRKASTKLERGLSIYGDPERAYADQTKARPLYMGLDLAAVDDNEDEDLFRAENERQFMNRKSNRIAEEEEGGT